MTYDELTRKFEEEKALLDAEMMEKARKISNKTNLLKALDEAKKSLDLEDLKKANKIFDLLSSEEQDLFDDVLEDVMADFNYKDSYLQKQIATLIKEAKAEYDESKLEKAEEIVELLMLDSDKKILSDEITKAQGYIDAKKLDDLIVETINEAVENMDNKTLDRARRYINDLEYSDRKMELKIMASDAYRKIRKVFEEEKEVIINNDADIEKVFHATIDKVYDTLDISYYDEAIKLLDNMSNEELKKQLLKVADYSKRYVDVRTNTVKPVEADKDARKAIDEFIDEKIIDDVLEDETEDKVETKEEKENVDPFEEIIIGEIFDDKKEEPVEDEIEETTVEEIEKDIEAEERAAAEKLVEKAKNTKLPEDINAAINFVKKLVNKDDKDELTKEISSIIFTDSKEEKVVEEKIDDEEATVDMESFKELLNELLSEKNDNKEISSNKLNKILNMAKVLDKEQLEEHKDVINEIVDYANAKEQVKEQNGFLLNVKTKVGKFAKAIAMIAALKSKNAAKRKVKYVRKYNYAKDNDDYNKANIYLAKLIEADEFNDYRINYYAQKIQATMALLKNDPNNAELKEDLEDYKKVFEAVAYDDLADKTTDMDLMKSEDRRNGLATSIAQCLAFVPESKKLNALKKDLLDYKSMTDIEKASYEYEFDSIKKFYEVSGNSFVSYDPSEFKYQDGKEEIKGVHTYKRRSK